MEISEPGNLFLIDIFLFIELFLFSRIHGILYEKFAI
jgi:hypothetical protein